MRSKSAAQHPVLRWLALAAGLGAVPAGPALAENTRANLAVTASVSANCTLTTASRALGSDNPAATKAAPAPTGSASVTVTCTKGTTPSITSAPAAAAGGPNSGVGTPAGAIVTTVMF
jgi:hypothetical protein